METKTKTPRKGKKPATLAEAEAQAAAALAAADAARHAAEQETEGEGETKDAPHTLSPSEALDALDPVSLPAGVLAAIEDAKAITFQERADTLYRAAQDASVALGSRKAWIVACLAAGNMRLAWGGFLGKLETAGITLRSLTLPPKAGTPEQAKLDQACASIGMDRATLVGLVAETKPFIRLEKAHPALCAQVGGYLIANDLTNSMPMIHLKTRCNALAAMDAPTLDFPENPAEFALPAPEGTGAGSGANKGGNKDKGGNKKAPYAKQLAALVKALAAFDDEDPKGKTAGRVNRILSDAVEELEELD